MQHDDICLSIAKVKEKFTNEIAGSKTKGCIQYYSIQPFTVGLWTEVHVEYFHQHVKDAVSLFDATGSIASKINGKMVLYYTFLLTTTTKKLEPLPLLEILTNSYDEKPIKWCLDAFIKDEKESYGHNVSTIPLIFTCDMSWPIIKTALRVFNNESVEEYYTIHILYKILYNSHRNATSKELSTAVSKTFIRLCL